MKVIINGETAQAGGGVSETKMNAAIDEAVSTKQDKLTGTTGQVVGFDADGQAVAQEAPTSGMTQEDADGRYLKLTGGTVTGPVSIQGVNIGCQDGESYILYADEGGAIHHGIEFLRGRCLIETMNSVGYSGGALEIVSPDVKETYDPDTTDYDSVVLRGVESPVFYHDAANKKYVDDAVGTKVSGHGIDEIKVVTSEGYNALPTKNATTLYVVKG